MRALTIAAALAFAAATAPIAHARPTDRSRNPVATRDGQCRGPDGKEATNAECKGAGPAPAASSIYKKDDKGQCRDENGKAVAADKCKLPK